MKGDEAVLKLGIIGGMGPEATQVMFRGIIERTDAKTDQEHLDIIILNHASMPDRTAAIKNGNTAEVVSLLKNDAAMLERCGAGVIAIPCNTSHFFINEIGGEIGIPIINMVEETAQYIAENRPEVKKAGILATDGTIGQGLYHRALEKRGIEPFTPDPAVQKTIMKIIYDQIKAGESGSIEDFAAVDYQLKKNGCDAAVLACTELSVFRTNHELNSFYIDAMQVLIDKCITFCGGRLKK